MHAYDQFSQVYDAFMGQADSDDRAQGLVSLLKERGIAPGAQVLDAACGTGRAAIALRKAGYRVTASDLSGQMLNVAAQNARNAAANIQFIQEDMRCVRLHENVSAVFATCDAVNYLEGYREAERFFDNAQQNLLPGGLLVFDISTKARLKEGLGDDVFFEEFDEGCYILQTQYEEDRCLMALTGFIREGALYRKFYEEHELYAFEIQELKQSLWKSGFEAITVSFLMQGDWIGTQRAQFVAQKRKG